MRIISKFHDYYDSAIGYGIDNAVTYVRNSLEFDTNYMRAGYEPQRFKNLYGAAMKVNERLERVSGSLFDHVFVGFCGKIYAGLLYSAHSDKLRVPVQSNHNRFGRLHVDQPLTVPVQAWSEKDLDEEELFKERGLESRWRFGCKNANEWFRVNEKHLVTENIELFAENECVAFVCTSQRLNRVLTIEPRLADFRFQRKMDSFTTFQEISMFISGVIGSPDRCQPEPISDELRAHTKGFDKRSFRKDPTKRK